ncbi:MAG: SIMPL domain-containing protein [Chromatiaceae bacterium]|jgi:predicted secreted protein
MHPALILSLVLAFFSALGHAHTDTPLYNRVSLNAAAETEVETDLLVAILFAQAEGREAAVPADEVNRLMDWAMSMLKGHADLKAQTLGYQSSAIYKDGKIRGWRVQQSLRLEGRDSRLLGDVIGELQAQLKVQSIDYQVSDERRREHVDALTATALARFQQRADHIAKSLGRAGYRLVRLNINEGGQSPMPRVGARMMSAQADSMVAPARIEAGTQVITVSVNGEIELSDD